MRDRFMGAIGVVWGGAILMRYVARGAPPFHEGAYGTGQAASLVLAALMLLVGLYYLLRVQPARTPR